MGISQRNTLLQGHRPKKKERRSSFRDPSKPHNQKPHWSKVTQWFTLDGRYFEKNLNDISEHDPYQAHINTSIEHPGMSELYPYRALHRGGPKDPGTPERTYQGELIDDKSAVAILAQEHCAQVLSWPPGPTRSPEPLLYAEGMDRLLGAIIGVTVSIATSVSSTLVELDNNVPMVRGNWTKDDPVLESGPTISAGGLCCRSHNHDVMKVRIDSLPVGKDDCKNAQTITIGLADRIWRIRLRN